MAGTQYLRYMCKHSCLICYRHNDITCIGICKEEKRGQSADQVAKGPIKLPDVVGDPARQRQREQDIGQRQVEQVDGGGVEFFLPLADHVENQTVATSTDEENQRVENREKDHGGTLVDEHIAAALVGGDMEVS